MNTKILLIEDDRTMVTLLRTLLSLEGFDVLQLGQADDLDAIMDVLHREQPALILLDVHLRQFNGFDLLYCLRQDADVKDIRVVMSSGSDFSDRCLAEGADGFILKPYMPEDLIKKLRHTLENTRTNRE